MPNRTAQSRTENENEKKAQVSHADKVAIDDVLSNLKNVPALNFSPNNRQSLNLLFPQLTEQVKTKPNHSHGAFENLFEFATRKHRFDQPIHDDWTNFVQFPNARLMRKKDGTYFIREIQPQTNERIINSSRRHCDEWFTQKFIPSIVRAQTSTNTFVTGQPGSGKSTLFKGLLNRQRNLLKASGVVVTRFESLKFDTYRKTRSPTTPLREALSDYIYLLLLRDIFYYFGYNQVDHGRIIRTQAGQLADSRIDTLLEEESTAPSHVRQDDAFLIREAMHRNDVDTKKLWKIDPRNREGLVNFFSKHYKFCIIFDGLDYFTLAHRRFDEDGYQTLQTLIDSLVLHGAKTKTDEVFSLPFDVHSVFVLRESTFSALVTDRLKPIKLADISKWEVRPINPRVALYNAISRGVTQIARAHDRDTAEEDAELVQRIMMAVDGLILFVNAELGVRGARSGDFFELFHGDMRQCFAFIGRVLSWVVKLERKRLLDDAGRIPFREAVTILSEDALVKTLRQRGYRLVEFLLCSEGWHFENSVFFVHGDAGDILAGRPSGKLQINASSDTCLDNIFNYHIDSHSNHLDTHCLLERLRILQILNIHTSMNARKIRTECLKQLGYELGSESHLASTLAILLHASYVEVCSTPTEMLFSISRKGRFLIDKLLQQQVYLEHVFHQTLFPERLVKDIDDVPRHKNWSSWTVASIRNCFIFLSYISCVESNRAGGVPVPETLRISAKIQSSLINSIEKILWHNARELALERVGSSPETTKDETTSFAALASKQINALTADWRKSGIIS